MNRIWRLVLYGTLLGVISIGFGFGCPWQADLYKSGSSGLPGQVTSPDPANGATNVPIDQQLGWAAASDATSYDVYFGTAEPIVFKINTTGTSYNPGTLSSNTIYYWCIDSVNPAGTTEGLGWDFQTASPLPDLVKTWGGADTDEPMGTRAVAVDGANNIYVAGQTVSFGAGDYDTVLLKYNSAGSLAWQKTWGTTGRDQAYALAPDTSGNIYVTGTTTPTNATGVECFVIKYNSSGVSTTARTWGDGAGGDGDYGYSIAVDSANNVLYVCGRTNSFGEGLSDAFLLKYDSALTAGPVVSKTWGSTGIDQAISLALDANGDIYLTGYTTSTGGTDVELFLVKYLADGNLDWQKTWGGNLGDFGYSVAVDGNYVYVAGITYSFGVGAGDFVLLKYDTIFGNLIWERVWGGTDNMATDSALSVAVDSTTGNICVTGYVSEPNFGVTTSGIALLEYNSGGTLLDEKVWYGTLEDVAYSVLVKGLNLYLVGYIHPGEAPWPANYTDSCAWYNVTGTETAVTGDDLVPTDQVSAAAGGTDADIFTDTTRSESTPAGVETGAGAADILLIRIEK